MRKRFLIVALLILCVILPLWTGMSLGRGGRYNFDKKHKQDVIRELDKRLRIIDSNLYFDDELLTITLPGAKGDKGDTGQAGELGKDGKPGLAGLSIVGPIGPKPVHRWDIDRLQFELPDGTWGPMISLLGPRGRQGGMGNAGQDGINGLDGRDGFNGTTPVFGIDYFNGENGTDGVNGIDGINGYTPQKNVDYFDGEDGRDGKDGKDGKDAKLPLSVTIQVLVDVKLHANGKLSKTYKQVKVYLE